MLLSSEDSQIDDLPSFTGVQLFHRCQLLAHQLAPSSSGKLSPSGARIFYFTRLVLLRRACPVRVAPDEVLLPPHVTSLFLQTIPMVAERLSVDFVRGLDLLAQPTSLLRWRAVGAWLRIAPEVRFALERVTGCAWQETNALPDVWERFWQETEQEYTARMSIFLRPERLRVTVVARPSDRADTALKLLRERLTQDQRSGLATPFPEAYLYDEPLIDWLIRTLAASTWFIQLGEILQKEATPFTGYAAD